MGRKTQEEIRALISNKTYIVRQPNRKKHQRKTKQVEPATPKELKTGRNVDFPSYAVTRSGICERCKLKLPISAFFFLNVKDALCRECRKVPLIKKYKVTSKQLDEMEANQQSKCAICKSKKPLVIDHCHKTGAVRGLLCYSCNTGIGLLNDNSSTLGKARDYLHYGM